MTALPDRETLIRTALRLGHAHDAMEERVIDLFLGEYTGTPAGVATWKAIRRKHDLVEYTLLRVYAQLKLVDPVALEAIRHGEEPAP